MSDNGAEKSPEGSLTQGEREDRVEDYEGVFVSAFVEDSAIKRESFQDFRRHKRETIAYFRRAIPVFFIINSVVFVIVLAVVLDSTDADAPNFKLTPDVLKLILLFLSGTFGLSIAAMIGLSGVTRQHWSDKSSDGDASATRELIRHYRGGGGEGS